MSSPPLDESYRSFAFLAAILTALHFILPIVRSAPSCSDKFAVVVPSTTFIWIGSVYSLAFLTWIARARAEDFFHSRGSPGQELRDRSTRATTTTTAYRRYENGRYLVFVWMNFAAIALLLNDLIVNMPRKGNLDALPWSLLLSSVGTPGVWLIWATLLIVAVLFFLRVSGHLISLGADAGVEEADIVVRRVERVKAKLKIS